MKMEKKPKNEDKLDKLKNLSTDDVAEFIGMYSVIWTTLYFTAVTFFPVANNDYVDLILGFTSGTFIGGIWGWLYSANKRKKENESDNQNNKSDEQI
jgi:hypothetical protein